MTTTVKQDDGSRRLILLTRIMRRIREMAETAAQVDADRAELMAMCGEGEPIEQREGGKR